MILGLRLEEELRRKREQAKSQKRSASPAVRKVHQFSTREQLRDVRVIQRNLVYIIGLPPHLASAEVF